MTEKPQQDSAFDQIRRADEQQFNIQIIADGRWFHDGGEIRRKALVKLFASVLKRDLAGLFWLETPVEKGRVEVADAPFIATRLTLQYAGTASTTADSAFGFVTNVDDEVSLDAAHPIQMLPSPDGGGIRPYIEVRDGLLAKLSRPVYYELASHAVAGQDGRMGVWSHNQFFVLE